MSQLGQIKAVVFSQLFSAAIFRLDFNSSRRTHTVTHCKEFQDLQDIQIRAAGFIREDCATAANAQGSHNVFLLISPLITARVESGFTFVQVRRRSNRKTHNRQNRTRRTPPPSSRCPFRRSRSHRALSAQRLRSLVSVSLVRPLKKHRSASLKVQGPTFLKRNGALSQHTKTRLTQDWTHLS